MRKHAIFVLTVALLGIAGRAGAEPAGDQTRLYPSPSEMPAPSDIPTPGLMDQPSPTDEPSPSPSETPAPSPSPSETPAPSPSPSETPAPSPSPSDTPAPSPSPSDTPTPSGTPTAGPGSGPAPSGSSPLPAAALGPLTAFQIREGRSVTNGDLEVGPDATVPPAKSDGQEAEASPTSGSATPAAVPQVASAPFPSQAADGNRILVVIGLIAVIILLLFQKAYREWRP
jgi:hypothetical protein